MRRTLIAFSLTASLATAPPGLFGRLWPLLSALWEALPAQQPQTKEGCGFDPSGQCKTSAPQTDAGCGFDPNGQCHPGS